MSSLFYAFEAVEIERFNMEAVERFCSGKGDEGQSRGKLAIAEVDGDVVKGHALRLVNSDRPRQSERHPFLIGGSDLSDGDNGWAGGGETGTTIA